MSSKLREAVEKIYSKAKEYDEGGEYLGEGSDPGFERIMKVCEAALSALPRNCDLYSHDEALRIWSSLPESEEDGCFDEWLFAEAKGESK